MTDRLCDFDDSNRSGILYNAIRPFMWLGASVLDIGCGFAHHKKFQGTILPRLLKDAFDITYHGVDNRVDVIAACRAAYPWAGFLLGDAATMPLLTYGLVMHLGFDRKDLSDAWKIHTRLLDAEMGPTFVLLEAGHPEGKQSKHVESFNEVYGLYQSAGYAPKASGQYTWTYKVTQPKRRFAVLERQ